MNEEHEPSDTEEPSESCNNQTSLITNMSTDASLVPAARSLPPMNGRPRSHQSSTVYRPVLCPSRSSTKLQTHSRLAVLKSWPQLSDEQEASKSSLKWKRGIISEKIKGRPLKFYPHRSKKPYQRMPIVQGIPRHKNQKLDAEQEATVTEDTEKSFVTDSRINRVPERIDIYYFDHGNSSYYLTTDSQPAVITERYAEKTDEAATRFWAEIFGTIHIAMTFVTAFVLQLLRFILFSLIRPLTVGIIQMIADYFIKPLLTILFNGLIQPLLILLYNIATSLRDLCKPIAEALGFFLEAFSHLFRAVRLVEINPQKVIHNHGANSPT